MSLLLTYLLLPLNSNFYKRKSENRIGIHIVLYIFVEKFGNNCIIFWIEDVISEVILHNILYFQKVITRNSFENVNIIKLKTK